MVQEVFNPRSTDVRGRALSCHALLLLPLWPVGPSPSFPSASHVPCSTSAQTSPTAGAVPGCPAPHRAPPAGPALLFTAPFPFLSCIPNWLILHTCLFMVFVPWPPEWRLLWVQGPGKPLGQGPPMTSKLEKGPEETDTRWGRKRVRFGLRKATRHRGLT